MQWQRRYGVEHGAAFGLSHGLNQLSVFRPSIRDGAVRGLYFVGASTRPGNGVPLCMISAALADERISADWSPGTTASTVAA
jgi:phytoene dehydrogenase-like protein